LVPAYSVVGVIGLIANVQHRYFFKPVLTVLQFPRRLRSLTPQRHSFPHILSGCLGSITRWRQSYFQVGVERIPVPAAVRALEYAARVPAYSVAGDFGVNHQSINSAARQAVLTMLQVPPPFKVL